MRVRGMLTAALATVAMINAGCLMVIGMRGESDHPRVIEVDGETYVLDDDSHTARKAEKVESTTTISVETEED